MCIEFLPLVITTGTALVLDSIHAARHKRASRIVDQVRIGGDARVEVQGVLHCFVDDDAQVLATCCWQVIAHGRSRITSIGGAVRGFDEARIKLRKGALGFAYGGEVDAYDHSIVVIPHDCTAQPVVRLHGKRARVVDQREVVTAGRVRVDAAA
jgi:hypothetical protein